jgi:hypothetical protein
MRRMRCGWCKKLKPRNPYHGSFCEDCVPVVWAEREARFQEHRAEQAQKRLAKTPTDHLAAAKTAIHHIRRDEYGLLDVSTVMLDVDAIEWFIRLAESTEELLKLAQGVDADWKP